MSQQNLNRRVKLARMAAKSGVLQKIPNGYRVPSRTLPSHHVVLAKYFKERGGAGYRMTCHYEHMNGQDRCPGNQFGHICWHCLAAVLTAAKGPVAFFEELSEAERYVHLGGKLMVIRSGDGSGQLYAAVRR